MQLTDIQLTKVQNSLFDIVRNESEAYKKLLKLKAVTPQLDEWLKDKLWKCYLNSSDTEKNNNLLLEYLLGFSFNVLCVRYGVTLAFAHSKISIMLHAYSVSMNNFIHYYISNTGKEDMPILAELNFSPKPFNSTTKAGIKQTMTVAEFCQRHSAKSLSKIPNFGRAALKEIRQKVAKYGYSLKGDLSPADVIPLQENNIPLLKDLGLSQRTFYVLARRLMYNVQLDVTTLNIVDFSNMFTEKDLLRFPAFGLVMLDDVKANLAKYGLSLKKA